MPAARIEARVKRLADFLNVKLENRRGFWRDLMREHLEVYRWLSPLQAMRGLESEFADKFNLRGDLLSEWTESALEYVQDLQWRVRTNLEHLLAPSADVGLELAVILDIIKGLNLRWEWHAEPVNAQGVKKQSGPRVLRIDGNKVEEVSPQLEAENKERLLKIGNQYWVVERHLYPTNLEQEVYGLIGLALESGYFARLKKCKRCSRFFVAEKNIDREFCPEPSNCTRLYFDRKDKSTPRVRESRLRIRNLQLQRARELFKQEKPFKFVQSKTRLPIKILEKLQEEAY